MYVGCDAYRTLVRNVKISYVGFVILMVLTVAVMKSRTG
jgi:hypothetical protein